MVWLLMRHRADQHAAAKVVHVGGNAHGAAGQRKAAVGRHQQFGAQGLAAGQGDLGALTVAAHLADPLIAQQRDVVVLLGAVQHRLVGGAPDQVVGHQPAQFAAPAQLVADHHGERRGAVQHPRVAQRRQRIRVVSFYALPQAQVLQQLCRMLGQCNFASVESRVGQRRFGLLFDQGHLQAVARQGTRQTQAGRAGATHDDVVIHGAHCSGAAGHRC